MDRSCAGFATDSDATTYWPDPHASDKPISTEGRTLAEHQIVAHVMLADLADSPRTSRAGISLGRPRKKPSGTTSDAASPRFSVRQLDETTGVADCPRNCSRRKGQRCSRLP